MIKNKSQQNTCTKTSFFQKKPGHIRLLKSKEKKKSVKAQYNKNCAQTMKMLPQINIVLNINQRIRGTEEKR